MKKGEKKREEAQGCNYGGLDPIVSVHHHLFMMHYAHACLKLNFYYFSTLNLCY